MQGPVLDPVGYFMILYYGYWLIHSMVLEPRLRTTLLVQRYNDNLAILGKFVNHHRDLTIVPFRR